MFSALNNKCRAKGIFCDIEKAFDCVNHNILLHKLGIYGIRRNSKNLYTQYLRDRYQRVILKENSACDDIVSFWSKIQHGVPQGSVLGSIQTRQEDNLYTPTSSLTLYQNGVYYTGINIFNKLPPEIRELVQMPNIFKSILRR
jgi:hypothetical protein